MQDTRSAGSEIAASETSAWGRMPWVALLAATGAALGGYRGRRGGSLQG